VIDEATFSLGLVSIAETADKILKDRLHTLENIRPRKRPIPSEG